MNKVSKILWGTILILIGLVMTTNVLEITNINLFFDGWWTLIIIIPSFIGIFDNSNQSKLGNMICLIIGFALLLATRGIFEFDIILKLIVPFIFLAIGVAVIFNETIKNKVSTIVKKGQRESTEEIAATFSEQRIKKDGKDFTNATLDAVFGSVVIDLTKANIKDEATIKASAIFGGIEILLPEDIKVEVKSTPIFGGVTSKNRDDEDAKKTIYIDAFCMFGGVEIK